MRNGLFYIFLTIILLVCHCNSFLEQLLTFCLESDITILKLNDNSPAWPAAVLPAMSSVASSQPRWLRLCLSSELEDGWTCEMVGSSHPSDARPEWSCQLSITARSDINHCYLLSSSQAPPPAPRDNILLPTASSLSTLTRSIESTIKVSCPESGALSLYLTKYLLQAGPNALLLANVFANIKKAILRLFGLRLQLSLPWRRHMSMSSIANIQERSSHR